MKKLLFLLILAITVVSCDSTPSRRSGYLGVESVDSTLQISQLFQVNLVLADSAIVDVYLYAIDEYDTQRMIEAKSSALPAFVSYSVRAIRIKNKPFKYTPVRRIVQ